MWKFPGRFCAGICLFESICIYLEFVLMNLYRISLMGMLKCLRGAACCLLVGGMLAGCGKDPFDHVKDDGGTTDDGAVRVEAVENAAENAAANTAANAAEITNTPVIPPLPANLPEKRLTGSRHGDRIPLYTIGPLGEIFNDSNKYQYAFAERIGIAPIRTLADAFYVRRPIVKIESNNLYEVDSLTHSMPFLVPEAAELLATVGRNFIDSLKHRGVDNYRIRVTSLLRSPHSVKKLRRVNRNATDSSTHQFGTTFDLSYTRFHCLDSTKRIHDGDLKNLLAEVLFDLRKRNKCLVKFERKTACYHVTVTGM